MDFATIVTHHNLDAHTVPGLGTIQYPTNVFRVHYEASGDPLKQVTSYVSTDANEEVNEIFTFAGECVNGDNNGYLILTLPKDACDATRTAFIKQIEFISGIEGGEDSITQAERMGPVIDTEKVEGESNLQGIFIKLPNHIQVKPGSRIIIHTKLTRTMTYDARLTTRFGFELVRTYTLNAIDITATPQLI